MSKGKEIIYMNIYIGNYLASNSILTIQEKKEAFLIRTRMTEEERNIKTNPLNIIILFVKKKICLTNQHKSIFILAN